jgi:hypothetical protein
MIITGKGFPETPDGGLQLNKFTGKEQVFKVILKERGKQLLPSFYG